MVMVKEGTCSVEDGAVFLLSSRGKIHNTKLQERKEKKYLFFSPCKKKHWGQLSETERGAFFTLGSIKTTVMT